LPPQYTRDYHESKVIPSSAFLWNICVGYVVY
jgi:hypothetical protein